jgi:hypothetical protein
MIAATPNTLTPFTGVPAAVTVRDTPEPLADAGTDTVSVLPLTAVMMVFAATPVPVIAWPTASPVVGDTEVMDALPVFVVPFTLRTPELGVTAVTTAPAPCGMPTPVRKLPATGGIVPRKA